MTKKRIAWIDGVKGIGIVLVVLAHSMSPVISENAAIELVYRLIYWMAIPLFMIPLGIVSGRLVTAQEGKMELLGKRAKRLMVPYCSWAVVYLFMKAVLKEYVRFEQAPLWTIIIGNNPAGQLWYAYVAFVLLTVAIFLVNPRNLPVWSVGAVIVSFLAPLIPARLSLPGIGLQYSLFQAGFFFIGLCLASRRDKAFCHGGAALICGILWCVYLAVRIFGIDPWYLKFPSAVCITYAIIFCTAKLPSGKVSDALSYLGQNSMNVYVLHAPILLVGRVLIKPILGEMPWIYSVVMTVGAMAISLLLSRYIIKRVKLLRFLLLGESD